MKKKKYAIVGMGHRCRMFLNALTDTYAGHCAIVAVCDKNPGRVELAVGEASRAGNTVKGYLDNQFDQMIHETSPDVVIVTTQDSEHDKYICRAMELGCDTITEKPMTTDEHKCQRIIDACGKTGRSCRTTFNYRYSPPRTQLKELLMSGIIGNVLSVDFRWLLNTRHGADYFRRWHRNKCNSGGLLVHKATHHFDIVNWLLGTVPETVFALGKRNFYRPETADRYGFTKRNQRCLGCREAQKCPFFLDLQSGAKLRRLYLDNEQHDGYFRDRCVFGEDIDIEDTLHLTVSYRNGATMSYSLHAFMPWEGFSIALNGSKGRLEHFCREKVYISGDGTVPGELIPEGTRTTVFPHFQPPYEAPLWTGSGGHGGGDPVLLEDLFSQNPPADKYMRAADHRAGAWSLLAGVAGNRSMEKGRPVGMDELVDGLAEPDYPPMPRADETIDAASMTRWLEENDQRKANRPT